MGQSAAAQFFPIHTAKSAKLAGGRPAGKLVAAENGEFSRVFSEALKTGKAQSISKAKGEGEFSLSIGELKLSPESVSKGKNGELIVDESEIKTILSHMKKQGMIDQKQADEFIKGEKSLPLSVNDEHQTLGFLTLKSEKGEFSIQPLKVKPEPGEAQHIFASLQAAGDDKAGLPSFHPNAIDHPNFKEAGENANQLGSNTLSAVLAANPGIKQILTESKIQQVGSEQARPGHARPEQDAARLMAQLKEGMVDARAKLVSETLEQQQGHINKVKQAQAALTMEPDGEMDAVLQKKIEDAKSKTRLDIDTLLAETRAKKQSVEQRAEAKPFIKPEVNAEAKFISEEINKQYNMRETAKGSMDDAALRILIDEAQGKSNGKGDGKPAAIAADPKAEAKPEIKADVKAESASAKHADSIKAQANSDSQNQMGQSNNGSKDQSREENREGVKQLAKAAVDKGALDAMSDKATNPMEKSQAADLKAAQQNQAAQTASQAKAPVDAAPVAKAQSAASTQSAFQDRVDQAQAASEQIVRGVKSAIGSERSQVSIRLMPESLGRVSVQITMENGVVTASLTAQKEATRAMLETHLNTLRAALDDNNVKVERIVITRETADARSQNENRDNQREDRMNQQRGGNGQDGGARDGERQGRNGRQWNFNDYWSLWNSWRNT